jgi:uncharacterized protein (DUF58 family)
VDESLEHRVRRLQFTCRKPVNSLLAGEYLSVFKGRGIEFEEVREYQPGDDIRNIDWNVTARTGHPYVKNYIEERELTLFLIMDVSASFIDGPAGEAKREAAAALASLLAYSAVRNNDRVGLIQFSSEIEQYIPPAKGDAHVQFLMEKMLSCAPVKKDTDVAEALEFLERTTRKRCIVFLFSDFQTPGYRDAVQFLSQHHDLITVSVCDTHENDLPDVGLVTLKDNETGRIRTVDTRNAQVRKRFSGLAEERLQRLAREFEDLDVDHLEIHTHEDYVHDLVVFFEMRKQRGGHVALG